MQGAAMYEHHRADSVAQPSPPDRERQPHGEKSADHARNQTLNHLLRPRDTGAPLPPDVRAQMQHRLGRDFGDVRLHDDADARDAARRIDAEAYTTGEDIVLGPSTPPLDSTDGHALLAHELT